MLRIRHRKLYMRDQGYKAAGLVITGILVEIRSDTLAQIFCLAYVQQLAVRTIIFIASGLVRDRQYDFTKRFTGHVQSVLRLGSLCLQCKAPGDVQVFLPSDKGLAVLLYLDQLHRCVIQLLCFLIPE